MQHDAIVIGGSFAGLSAAIHIARSMRSVCVIDAGNPRNSFVTASHGFFGQDGAAPLAMVATARAQLQAYPTVRTIAGKADAARAINGGFEVTLAAGETLTAAKLVLAFGVSDELPDLPGIAERWGKTVLHCPYCHGFEYGGGRMGVLQTMPMSQHQALLIADWGPTTLYLNGGDTPGADMQAKLTHRGVAIQRSGCLCGRRRCTCTAQRELGGGRRRHGRRIAAPVARVRRRLNERNDHETLRTGLGSLSPTRHHLSGRERYLGDRAHCLRRTRRVACSGNDSAQPHGDGADIGNG
jgi:hypothetical protein